MQNATKYALEASLKKFLLKKPVDKITISDLTNDCGISRMSFYYHFKDIYDLVEWACFEDAAQALQGKKTHDTWQEGLMQIFEAVMENKPFILKCLPCTEPGSDRKLPFSPDLQSDRRCCRRKIHRDECYKGAEAVCGRFL